jgi:threonylcarbamoyladenosine tRNA methylthiotransferase MtaB
MQFYADHIGAVREVLLEEDKKDGFLSGFTDNYIRVRIPADGKHVNEIVEVKLEEITSKGKMKATLLETEIGV